MNTAPAVARPRQVKWALWLFWATIAFAVIKLAITLLVPATDAQRGVVIVSFLAIFVLMALTIIYIGQGAGWARGVMLALFLIGIAPALPLVLGQFQRAPILAAFTLAQAIAQVVGLYLVYSRPGIDWFRRGAN